MRRATVWAGLLLAGATGIARAGDEPVPPAPPTAVSPAQFTVPGNFSPTAALARPFPPDIVPTIPDKGPPTPTLPPPRPADDLLSSRLATPFATQTSGGGFQGRSFNEEFDGDFGGVFYRRTVQTGTTTQTQQIGTTTQKQQVGTKREVVRGPNGEIVGVITVPVFADVTVPVFGNVTVPVFGSATVPIAGLYSGIMITDNDSPRPTDRLYFGFSYYDGLGNAFNPGANITMSREIVGFEKRIFDGNVSIGMRLPFIQVGSSVGASQSNVGDMSLLFKWAVINNLETGDILSFGLVLTTPTSPAAYTGVPSGELSDGESIPHSTLFQPWGGFVRTFGRGYVQFISDAVLPSNRRDTYIWGNSLGLGYQLVRGGGLMPSVTPTFETHVRTPLNNRDPNGLIYLQDQVNLTTGVHVRWSRVSVSGAVCIPVVSPLPWNVEALANLNIRF